jgi:hypothetical protein
MTVNENLNQLLNIMLDVVLNDTPYPGQKAKKSFFPDVEVMKQQDEIVVSDQNLTPHCVIDVHGYKICIIPQEKLPDRAAEHGDFPYLALTEVSWSGYSVVMSLQMKWAVSEANLQKGKRYMGGGGVRVKFILEDGNWIAPSGPMATWMS